MRIAVFSAKPYDRESLEDANLRHGHKLAFFEARLSASTAGLARGFDAVCPYVNARRRWMAAGETGETPVAAG